MVRDPTTKTLGDFYLHSHRSEKLKDLTGAVDGFAFMNNTIIRLQEAKLKKTKSKFALGFYRWPISWQGSWQNENSSEKIDFDFILSKRKTFSNWFVDGFAMGIVKGSIVKDGQMYEVYGLGEIIQ